MMGNLQDLKIIFLGTPEFGAIILEKLVEANFKPILVVTETDKPVGRKQIITPPPVKIATEKHNIPLEQPEQIKNLKLKIKNLKPDLGIVAAYGQIIPKDILDIPKYGFLNIHPSLLPKYRGPSPIQTAILNGDAKTGVTIMQMDEKVDHGRIVSSIEYSVSSGETYETLSQKLAELGAEILVKTIPDWIDGKIKPEPQDEIKATYTKLIKKDDGKIGWQKAAELIERQVRALNPWPGTYTICNGKILKILEADVVACPDDKEIGRAFLNEKRELAVKCGQNCLILLKIQLEGGKPLSAQNFLQGHRDIIGSILE